MVSDLPQERLERLRAQVSAWAERARTMGLSTLLGGLLSAAAPLGPVAAGALWVAQPALGLFAPRQTIGDLAHLLADPDGVAWLRQVLADDTDKDGDGTCCT